MEAQIGLQVGFVRVSDDGEGSVRDDRHELELDLLNVFIFPVVSVPN